MAKELNVWPWDVDNWLLWGCPAKQILKAWAFDLEKVKVWLETEKIKIKRIKPRHSITKAMFDQRWYAGRCPICIDRGLSGKKAAKVYTLGEVSEGEWHLRRTGIPCGHSAYIDDKNTSILAVQDRERRRSASKGGKIKNDH